jgi:hypothetical protein
MMTSVTLSATFWLFTYPAWWIEFAVFDIVPSVEVIYSRFNVERLRQLNSDSKKKGYLCLFQFFFLNPGTLGVAGNN